MLFLLTGLLLLVSPAAAQPLTSVSGPRVTPEMRERLLEGARDAAAEPWKREFMQGLARGGVGAANTSSPRPAVAQRLTQGGDDGAWIPAPQPSARFCHTAIYDPARQRMIVFGGYDGSFRNDVWALSLTGTPVWSDITPSGPAPTPRNVHTAIYDPVRDRMIVFGGYDVTGAYMADLWELNLSGEPTWSPIAATGTAPSGRGWHSAIYDPIRDRMVVYGGRDAGTINGDAWELALSGTPAWTELTPGGTAPPARFSHAAIYDPVRDRMVVFAGDGGGEGYRNDLWAMSLSGSPEWTQLTLDGTLPTTRPGLVAVYDATCDRMVVFGGYDGGFLNDVWGLTLSESPTCSPLVPGGDAPAVRGWHSAIFDPVNGGLITFGGEHSPFEPLKDVWRLSLNGTPAWSALSLGGVERPDGRSASAAIMDPLRNRMVMFGGGAGIGPHNDVWLLSLAGVPTWSTVTPLGTPPPARRDHTAIYDPVRQRMLVFGGRDGTERFNDVWALSLDGNPVWSAIVPSGTPPAGRFSHTAVYDPVRDRMVVFGGTDSLGRFSDVWALTLNESPEWVDITPEGAGPSARLGHSAIYDPGSDAMVMFGGSDTTLVNDLWSLSLAGDPVWSELTPAGTPPEARGWHSVIYDPYRHRMVVQGGWDGTFRNDLWSLSLSGGPTWAPLSPSGDLPDGRISHVAVYDVERGQMLLYGGDDGTTYREDLWLLAWGASAGPVSVPGAGAAARFDLAAPWPMPSRGPVTLGFSLLEASQVVLEVYDAQGRRVRQVADAWFSAGPHTLPWQGDDAHGRALNTGVYFIRMRAGGFEAARRAMLIR